jgi:hypothetical protein
MVGPRSCGIDRCLIPAGPGRQENCICMRRGGCGVVPAGTVRNADIAVKTFRSFVLKMQGVRSGTALLLDHRTFKRNGRVRFDPHLTCQVRGLS